MARSPRPHGLGQAQRGGILFRLVFLVFFLCALFALYLVRRPLFRLAGHFWVVDEAPAASDAIVVLGDDNYRGDRAARAAELFKAGWAPLVVASGRYLRPYASIAELEEHDLTEHGVPRAAVVRYTHFAENTRDEALEIRELMVERGWKRILVVTSDYHTRRSRYICTRAFPPGTVLRVVAARDSEYDPDRWWHTRQGQKLFFHEVVGMVMAMWEMRHSGAELSDSASAVSMHRPVAG